METYSLPHDIKVFYIVAQSFPKGIAAAHQKLHNLLPYTEGRQFFGISYPNPLPATYLLNDRQHAATKGQSEIVYKAAVEEAYAGEAEKYGCPTCIIRKGSFLRETLIDWHLNENIVAKTFQKLLADPRIDALGYCLEVYLSETDMRCMVPLNAKCLE